MISFNAIETHSVATKPFAEEISNVRAEMSSSLKQSNKLQSEIDTIKTKIQVINGDWVRETWPITKVINAIFKSIYQYFKKDELTALNQSLTAKTEEFKECSTKSNSLKAKYLQLVRQKREAQAQATQAPSHHKMHLWVEKAQAAFWERI